MLRSILTTVWIVLVCLFFLRHAKTSQLVRKRVPVVSLSIIQISNNSTIDKTYRLNRIAKLLHCQFCSFHCVFFIIL